MRKWKQTKLAQLLNNRQGLTLVEMVVTFALLGIFMISVTGILSSSFSIFERVRSTASAQYVSEIVIDKIAGEISSAQAAGAQYGITIADGQSTADSLDFAAGSCIAFSTRTGSPVYITVADGGLLIHYRPVMTVVGGELKPLNAVDWTYDARTYQGFVVTALNFSKVTDTNIIEIRLELQYSKTGMRYQSSRYVECYNFQTEADFAKIVEGPIAADSPP